MDTRNKEKKSKPKPIRGCSIEDLQPEEGENELIKIWGESTDESYAIKCILCSWSHFTKNPANDKWFDLNEITRMMLITTYVSSWKILPEEERKHLITNKICESIIPGGHYS
ncbi:hypothetical protein ACFLZ4_01470 [Patescibacteria group bacterium]